jgi:hypothetical protein
MHSILMSLISSVLAGFQTRLALQMEILALQHQIIVLRRSVSSRPKLQASDRFLWIWLSRLWPEWRSDGIFGRDRTVIAAVAADPAGAGTSGDFYNDRFCFPDDGVVSPIRLLLLGPFFPWSLYGSRRLAHRNCDCADCPRGRVSKNDPQVFAAVFDLQRRVEHEAMPKQLLAVIIGQA